MLDLERNRGVFEAEYYKYKASDLMPAEAALVERFRDRWADMDVLDIGVGCGRTAHTLARLGRSYLGIDYSPAMIDECRRTVGESDRVSFAVMDARLLPGLADQSYDLAVFSFNGIDYVDESGREMVLRAVHRVCRPGGHFFFSSHSMASLPACSGRWAPTSHDAAAKTLAWRARSLVTGAVYRLVNRDVDWQQAKSRGWAIVRDSAHRFQLRTFYVQADYQVAELARLGFEVLAVHDAHGQELKDYGQPPVDPWLSYLCRRSA